MHYSQLGYDTYDDYLSGEEWREIHDLFYRNGGAYRCRTCHDNKKLILHKRSYAHLDPEFFYDLIEQGNLRLLRMILVWQCPRDNELIHFYDKKKKYKVPLDYLFLWEQEKEIYRRPDMAIRRFCRTTKRVILWFYFAYRISQKRKRFY